MWRRFVDNYYTNKYKNSGIPEFLFYCYNHLVKYLIPAAIVLILVVSFFIPKKHNEPIPSSDFSKDDVITLDRTACFGYCPDYSLIIHSDGRVIYKGRSYVRVIGKREGAISPEDFKKLADEFYKIDYFTLKDVYDTNFEDVPAITTSITIDGKTKKVINKYVAEELPDEIIKLNELQNNIDKAANTEKWTKKLIELG